jgi:hypothetical protein
MTIGAALLLIAAGAILRFALATTTTHGVDLHTIGDILMVVGLVGLVIWACVWAPWVRRNRRPAYRQPVDEQPPPPSAYEPADRYPPERYTQRTVERHYDDPY